MNFMGVGLPEVAVIMLVAFLVLGPTRSIGMARKAGTLIRDLRRSFSEVAAAVSLEQEEQSRSPWKPKPPPDTGEDASPNSGNERP